MGHYVYYSFEEGGGRGYIGVRHKDPGGDEGYLGSFYDPTFKPSGKIIIREYDTAEGAIRGEIALHALFNVGAASHFANRAKQTHKGFSTAGATCWKNELTQKSSICFDKPEGEGWERGLLQKSVDKRRAKRRGATHWKNELTQKSSICFDKPEGEGWERGVLQKSIDKRVAKRRGATHWKNELTQEQTICFDKPGGEGWEPGVLQKSKDKNRASQPNYGNTGALNPLSKAIIAIQPDGTKLHFGGRNQAARELGIDPHTLLDYLNKGGVLSEFTKYPGWLFRYV